MTSRYNGGINEAEVKLRGPGKNWASLRQKIIHLVSLASVSSRYDSLGFQTLSIVLEEEWPRPFAVLA